MGSGCYCDKENQSASESLGGANMLANTHLAEVYLTKIVERKNNFFPPTWSK